MLSIACFVGTARADEGGGSFWLVGTYAMQAAIASAPGFSIDMTYYTSSISSKRWASTPDGRLEVMTYINPTYLMLTPSYAFERSVLGGQLEVGLTVLGGNYRSTVASALFSTDAAPAFGADTDSMTAFGDLFPQVSLKWNSGVHNYMIYAAGNVPVGNYDVNRQASVGSGTWAFDAGAGYTWYDTDSGREVSIVLGATYNFMDPYTAYQSGIDLHVEASISQYVTENLSMGVAGYFLKQITGDSGSGAVLGPFMGQVAGLGPQIGYDFNLGGRAASLAARSYYEFAGENRSTGWNAWLSLTIAWGPFEGKLAKGR